MRMMIKLKEQDHVESTTLILANIEGRECFLEENGHGFYPIRKLVWGTSKGTVTISFEEEKNGE